MWKRILIWSLTGLFGLIVMPLTFLLSLYSSFFNENFYSQDLAKFAYTVITEHPSTVEDEKNPLNLTTEDLSQILKQSFTVEDFSKFFGNAFESVKHDLSNVENPDVTLHVPLDIFKGKQMEISAAAAKIVYARIPVCADKVVPQGFECREKNLSKLDFDSRVFRTLDLTLFSKLPNTFDIKMRIPEFFGHNPWGFVENILEWIFVGGYLLALAILGLIVILIRKETKFEVFRRISKIIFSPSFLLMVFAVGLFIAQLKLNSTDPKTKLILDFIVIFMRAITTNLLIYVIPVFILSSVGVVYAQFAKSKYESQ